MVKECGFAFDKVNPTMKLCGRQPPHMETKTMTDETTNTEQSRVAADCPNERLVMCDECRDTGEKVIFNDRFAEGYAIVFCGCINGRVLAATQADALNEHGA